MGRLEHARRKLSISPFGGGRGGGKAVSNYISQIQSVTPPFNPPPKGEMKESLREKYILFQLSN